MKLPNQSERDGIFKSIRKDYDDGRSMFSTLTAEHKDYPV